MVQDLCPLRSDLLFFTKIVALLPGCISRLCVVVSKSPFVQVKQHLAEQVQKFDNAKAESEAPVSPSSVGRSPSAGRSRKETNSQHGWHRAREVVLSRLPFDGFAMDDHDHQ